MTMKRGILIAVLAFILWLFEFVLYVNTGMRTGIHQAGLPAVIAYKFLWLMVLTFAAGIFAPVGAFLEKVTRRNGYIFWAVLVTLWMIAYTALSFMRAAGASSMPEAQVPVTVPNIPPSSVPVVQVPPAAVSAAPVPAPANPASQAPPANPNEPKITEVLTFGGADAKKVDSETIAVTLKFQNKSASKAVTEMDYTFGVAGDNKLLFRLNMREGTYIPPAVAGQTDLTWKKTNFKNAQEFDQLRSALDNGTLKIFATPTRAVMDDGTIVGEKE